MIQHTRTGKGRPPIVLVHGFGCARSDWDLQVAHLAQHSETIAVDLGGHGTTPGTSAHARLETHGADVAELLRGLDLRGAVLIGHSMGCRVIMEAAAREPARVAGVILVDGSRMGQAGVNAHTPLLAEIKAKGGYASYIRPVFESMFAKTYPADKAAPIVERAARMPAEIAGPLFADIRRYDSEHMDRILSLQRWPFLAIQTTRIDQGGNRVSMKSGETTPYLDLIRSKVAGARIEIIPSIGHFPQVEAPAALNQLLERFVVSLRS
ncbi:MAG TPA: alpha/beta hydrolase [Hyphomicrobiaceae bacterium]|nr:alpha/beta hydrolase [Hyphomicrobiaceae bacterium]